MNKHGINIYTKYMTAVIVAVVITAFSLTACGRNKDSGMNNETTLHNNSTDNGQIINSESSSEPDNRNDAQIQQNSESKTDWEETASQDNTYSVIDNNIDKELQSESRIPETAESINGDSDKNSSTSDSGNSGNNKIESGKPDPIELPFVPAY